jgi:hypothetical protein
MNEDLEAFRDELQKAGQPWSQRGVQVCGLGVVGLLVSQVAPVKGGGYTLLVALALASLLAIIVGWVFLVMAFLKRRRWARAHPLVEPPLTIDPPAAS